jgi:hypothetical protein
VSGDYAFVADGAAGLLIIDITNPTNPTLKGTYSTPSNATAVAVAGDLAFVADYDAGLLIIDITNPASPVLEDSYDTPGLAYDAVLAGGLAFVADDASGLQIVDFSDRAVGPLTGSYDTPGSAWSVAVAGDLAFVADYDSGLQVIDITNPGSPTFTGSYETSSLAIDVAVAGDLAFLAEDLAGLEIVDITNPANPTFKGIYDTPGSATGVTVEGDLAFVADDASLQIIDITDPASPTFKGVYNTPGSALSVAVSGDLAFVACYDGGLEVIDISDPTDPIFAGNCGAAPDNAFSDVVVSGDLAYIANATSQYLASNFLFVDISDPTSPLIWAGVYVPSVFPTGVAVAGDLAIVAGASVGIIEITNPGQAEVIGTYDTPGSSWGVTVAGDHAFVADLDGGVQIIQVAQREVDGKRNIGRSLSVGGDDAITRARLSTTQTAGVTWAVTTIDPPYWQPIMPDQTWIEIEFPVSDLFWRSTHVWTGVDPTVSELRLEWLYDYAHIDAVTDLPNDQGGQVRLEWTRSGHDFVGDANQIVEYAVYRRIDPDLSAAATTATATPLEHLSPAARENALMMQAAGWDFITAVPVLVEDSYALIVPTLKDSTVVGGPYLTTFRVTALTATPGVFYHSPPDSGYSVDNLAPSVPTGFSIAYNTGYGNTLYWDGPFDPDFQYFRVYRSNEPDFTPSPTTLVHASTSSSWVDPEYDGGGVYYKVTATDFSGNESDAATAGSVTAVQGPQTPHTFALHRNLPNPFNPTTLIRYDVPEGGGAVTLRVFDVGGRMVCTLVDGPQSPGAKSVTWDGRDGAGRPVASGVYFYRMQAPGFAATRKMVMLK